MTKKRNKKAFTLYCRNGIFYVRVWDDNAGTYSPGKSTGMDDRDAAAVEAARMIEDGEIKLKEKNPFFLDELLKYWQNKKDVTPRYHAATVSSIEKYVYPFPEFQNLRMSKVRAFHINRFIDWLEEQGRPASNINRIVGSVKQFCTWAYSRGYMPKNITDGKQVEKKKYKKQKRGELRPPEIMKLAALDWPDHRIKCAVMLGCFAGLRLGEVRGLRWRDVDFQTNYIYVRQNYTGVKDSEGNPVYFTPKADSGREFPYMVFPELRAALLKQWEETPFKGPDDLVLPNVWEKNWSNQTKASGHAPLPDTAIKSNFYKMLESIGIPPEEIKTRYLSFHSTRHSFTSFIDMAGSSKTAMSLTGHSTREMLENYSHANEQAVIEHLNSANIFLDKFRAGTK